MKDDSAPSSDSSVPSRLTAVEHRLSHFREIAELRHSQVSQRLDDLKTHNNSQDANLEVMEEKLLVRIAEIYQLLWSGMKWLGALFVTTLLTIALKSFGLV